MRSRGQDGPEGIDVCLTCFNGGCVDPERKHAYNHYSLTGHPLALNIRRITLDKAKRVRKRDESDNVYFDFRLSADFSPSQTMVHHHHRKSASLRLFLKTKRPNMNTVPKSDATLAMALKPIRMLHQR